MYKNCTRKVCVFAHTPKQLRFLLNPHYHDQSYTRNSEEKEYSNNGRRQQQQHYCCHCTAAAASPSSTLMRMSHFSPSPPPPPVKSQSMSGVELNKFLSYKDALIEMMECLEFSPISGVGVESVEVLSYKDALIKLVGSFKSMNVNEDSSHEAGKGDDPQQSRFCLSPSTPSHSGGPCFFTGEGSCLGLTVDNGPDLGWVNDLLT